MKELKYLFAGYKNLLPNSELTLEITSQSSDAFKAVSLQIRVVDSTPKKKSSRAKIKSIDKPFVEIADIRIMGEPQLINYNGFIDATQRGTSRFFEIEKEVDFSVFGGSNGKGLNITIINPYNKKNLDVFIIMSGYSEFNDLIGKIGE